MNLFKKSFIKKLLLSLIFINFTFGNELLSNSPNKNNFPLTEDKRILLEDYYLLGPGDQLLLKVFDAPELDQDLLVLNDGSIQIPFAGSVVISELTLDEASKKIKLELEKFLIKAEIQLKIIKQRPARVSVVGEVIRPGVYYLSAASKKDGQEFINPSILNAIQKAGGITSHGNLKDISLIRKYKKGSTKYKKTTLDFSKLIKDGDLQQNPYLFDGDVIKIPKADLKTKEEDLYVKRSSLSPEKINVYIIGEVKEPGPIELNPNTPLLQAVLAAGGPTDWRANKGNIQLIRINENGTATSKKFRLDLNKGISQKNNPLLKESDTIFVQRNALAFGGDVIKSFAEPALNILNVYTLLRVID